MEFYAFKGNEMEHKIQNQISEYQLRYAAGKYFLIHMKQKGVPYERPLQLNAMAAEFLELLWENKTEEQMADILAKKYKIAEAEIREDVRVFCQQLNTLGIRIKE